MSEAHVFEHSQVDQARRANAVTIRIRAAIADQIEAEFALGSFDAAVRFAGLRSESTKLRLRIHDWTFGDFRERLVENLQRLAHFEDANHVAVEHITVLADGHAEIETVVDTVFVHLANV